MSLNLNARTLVMVGVALLAAGATALFARGWLNAERAAMGSGPAYEILVAKTDVPAGYFVKAQDLRWQGWPKGTLAPAYALKGKRTPEDFDGAVVRHGLVAGQPITDTQVVRPGEQGFLAAVLQPGMRAVSIQVNAITGISGFVIPGDRVDMVLTHTVRSEDGEGTRHVSETVLQDLRVLAVDQKIDDQKGKAAVAKTVTLEVTPKQVEKIGIVNKIGKISLSLRPIARETPPAAAPAPGLNAIGSARASELADPDAARDEIADAVIAEIAGEAEAASETSETPAPAPVPLPVEERGGITVDSEVSRVLGHRQGSGRTVRVTRGGTTEEQKF